MKNKLEHSRLIQLLNYDPETGVFAWKTDKTYFATAGCRAGVAKNNEGYARIGIDGCRYLAHRLAWFYMTENWPIGDIDHINRNRADNRFSNLRNATRSQNLENRAISEKNTSGEKGVYWHARAKKWCAQIKHNKKHIYLGLYASIADAAKAYQDASFLHHTHRPS